MQISPTRSRGEIFYVPENQDLQEVVTPPHSFLHLTDTTGKIVCTFALDPLDMPCFLEPSQTSHQDNELNLLHLPIPPEVEAAQAKIYTRTVDGDDFNISNFRGAQRVTFGSDSRTYVGHDIDRVVEPKLELELEQLLLGLSHLEIIPVPDLPHPIDASVGEENLHLCWVKDPKGNFVLLVFDNAHLKSSAWFKQFTNSLGSKLIRLYGGDPGSYQAVDHKNEGPIAKITNQFRVSSIALDNQIKDSPPYALPVAAIEDLTKIRAHYGRILTFLYPEGGPQTKDKGSKESKEVITGMKVEPLIKFKDQVISSDAGAYLTVGASEGTVFYYNQRTGRMVQEKRVDHNTVRIKRTAKGVYVFGPNSFDDGATRIRTGVGGGREWAFPFNGFLDVVDADGTEVILTKSEDGFFAKVPGMRGYTANKLTNYNMRTNNTCLTHLGGRMFLYLHPFRYSSDAEYCYFTLTKGEDSSSSSRRLPGVEYMNHKRVSKVTNFEDKVLVLVENLGRKTNRTINAYTLNQGISTRDSRINIGGFLEIPENWRDLDFIIDGDEMICASTDSAGKVLISFMPLDNFSKKIDTTDIKLTSSNISELVSESVDITDKLEPGSFLGTGSVGLNLDKIAEKLYLLRLGKNVYRIQR